MTASPTFSETGYSSQGKVRLFQRKNPAGNSGAHMTEADVLADVVVKALWASFPEEHSEDAIATAASPYFRNRFGEPISPRTIKYWLRRDTLPSALHLSTLVMMQPKMFLGFWLGGGDQ